MSFAFLHSSLSHPQITSLHLFIPSYSHRSCPFPFTSTFTPSIMTKSFFTPFPTPSPSPTPASSRPTIISTTTTTMGLGNSFGRLFRISTFGESHGGAVGVVVDGCPPQLALSEKDIQYDLNRRRPGQSRLTTPRDEQDVATILSGLDNGLTVGTPIAITVANKDQRSQDYDTNMMAYRPSHADATYDAKYGIRVVAGGGRSSARETIGRVAAGAIARKILKLYAGVEVIAYVKRVKDIETHAVDLDTVTIDQVEESMVRCPDPVVSEQMIQCIDEVRKSGNSIGGVIECVVRNVPAGLGDPVFDKLEADLAKAIMSLPATKGFEIGSGFAGTLLTGHEHNDPFGIDKDSARTRALSNRSGGVQGGISNGENIVIRACFKPTSTIGRAQNTVSRNGQEMEMRGKGRHDPCVLPRAVVMVEAMVALVLVDHLMMQIAQNTTLNNLAYREWNTDSPNLINPLGKLAPQGTVLGDIQRSQPNLQKLPPIGKVPEKPVSQRVDEE